MRRMLFLAAVLAAWLAVPAAHAVVIQATYTGTTFSSTVVSGDPCATGLSGAGGCTSLPIVVNFRIDTSLLAPDRNGVANVACSPPSRFRRRPRSSSRSSSGSSCSSGTSSTSAP